MYCKCNGCGRIFEEDEAGVGSNDLGTCFGFPCSERVTFCPFCGSEFEEVDTCEMCGEPTADEDLIDGVCKECLYDRGNDIEVCYEVGKSDTEKVKINCFLARMFDADEINGILMDVLRERNKEKKADCAKFIDEDPYWFVENMKEVKNDDK